MSHPWVFPWTPKPPGWEIDWDGIRAWSPLIAALDGCPQDPKWHAEGDVGTHTRMVCESLAGDPRWRKLPALDREILFAAAVLHDVGKPPRTRAGDDGAVTSRGHTLTGARVARELLWHTPGARIVPPPLDVREQIAALVRWHALPEFLVERESPRRAVIEASMTARTDLLALLAECDIKGRISRNSVEAPDRIAIFRDCCAENQCWARPYPFPSAHSRFDFFQTEREDPEREVYDDRVCDVVMLSGLPASGKDRFSREHFGDWPVTSLDALREELDVEPTESQGSLAQEAKERARRHLRDKQGFVWNATNTTRRTRRPLVSLFAAYGARVRIVCLEAPLEELLRRNARRSEPVPEAVYEKLIRGLDVPDGTEAHRVELIGYPSAGDSTLIHADGSSAPAVSPLPK